MKNVGLEKAISLLGTQKILAQKCGKAQSTICDWLHGRKRVSAEIVPLIVRATEGKVLAYEIRPDLPDLFPHPER